MPNTVPNGDIPSIVKLAKANKSQKSKEVSFNCDLNLYCYQLSNFLIYCFCSFC